MLTLTEMFPPRKVVNGDSNEALGTLIVPAVSRPAQAIAITHPAMNRKQYPLMVPTDTNRFWVSRQLDASRAARRETQARRRARASSQPPKPTASRLTEAGSGTALRRTLSKSQFPNDVFSMGTVDSI